MPRHCVSVLLLLLFCIAQECLAFVPSWTATFRSSRSQPPALTPAAATFSLSQPSGATCLVPGTFGACGAQVRGITSLSALSEGNEEEGGGDHDTREAAGGSPAADEIRAVQDEIRGVERKIEHVERETEEVAQKIDDVEAAIAEGAGYLGMTDPEALLKKEEQLRKEKEQLRTEKEQLRKKEERLGSKEDRLRKEKEQLRANNAPAGAAFLPANNRIAMFGATFTKAAAGNNTLELVNGTFFLGDQALGCKLFIRPCYRKLSERILNDCYKRSHLVVTGTPGIGKSVFGLYLMYLLRCEGKTVVFERKSCWYRFNDEGVIEGDVASFRKAGFLDDESSWYLSDPDGKPQELSSLRTVVLVSPNYERTKEFMKLSGLAKRIFMPVWKLDELLDCQCALFPHVPSDVVKQRFAAVGGVARAVFDEVMFDEVKKGIRIALQTRSVRTLINAASTWQGQFRTEETGDKLFHMWSSDVDDFTECTIELASNYTGDEVVSTIDKRGSEELEDLLAAAFDYPDVARMIGGSVRGKLFERLAHRRIGEARIAKEPFKMAILNSSEVLSGDSLNFSFSASKEFKGNDFPSDFESGIYYTPVSQNFPAIDAFGVGGSDNDTLFLFQMKSTGAESGDGRVVGQHWNVAKKSASPKQKNVAKKSASLKHLVFVFVVPEETQWKESMKLKLGGSKSKSKNWLTGAPPDVKSCGVCIVGIPVKR